jgi:hypothetical protein
MFLSDAKQFYVCFTRSTVLFIWMNKQKSNIHSSYMHIYNVRRCLLPISRLIRRTVIFSLEVKKIVMNVF